MVRVAPSPSAEAEARRDATSTRTSTIAHPQWMYELCPSAPLPTLDLSISMKSRFLSRVAFNKANAIVKRRRGLISVAASFGVVSYFLTLFLPVAMAQPFGLITAVLYLPNVLAGFSLLRYEVVCTLLGVYDFWFFSIANMLTFAVLGAIMGDVRALGILVAWSGAQLNIMVDANIRAVKLWVLFNILGTVSYVTTWFAVSFALIDRANTFPLVRNQSQDLPAEAFASSGLITVIALVSRNVYRKRQVFRKKADISLIECVSYRTDLKYLCRSSTKRMLSSRLATSKEQSNPEYMKPLRYVKQVGMIDPHNTLLKLPWIQTTSSAPLWFSTFFHWYGVMAGLFAIGSVFYNRYAFGHVGGSIGAVAALILTSAYCGTYVVHYQRKVLVALCTSFDFVFLSVQLSVVHLCVCAFFFWGKACLAVLASWIWIHWVVCLDAVPPVMKRKLGLRKRFAVSVLLVFIALNTSLTYLRVFAADMTANNTRVVYRISVFGHGLDVHLMHVFYNCFPTVMLLCLRLLWRLVRNDSDVLLVLDGAVAYENYLQRAKHRRSRRWSLACVQRNPTAGANF